MRFTLLSALCLGFVITYAQIEETTLPMSKGEHPCYILKLPKDIEVKNAERIWTKLLRQYSGKVKRRDGELFADDTDIPAMSENTVDVYAHFFENPSDLELIVWFDLGGAYLHSAMHPDRDPVAKDMLNEFNREVKIDMIEREMKLEEDELKEIEKELASLERDNDNLNADILRMEEKIAEAKAQIEFNKEMITQKETERAEQEKSLEAVVAKMENL